MENQRAGIEGSVSAYFFADSDLEQAKKRCSMRAQKTGMAPCAFPKAKLIFLRFKHILSNKTGIGGMCLAANKNTA